MDKDNWVKYVEDFRTVFKQPMPATELRDIKLQMDCVREEFKELEAAIAEANYKPSVETLDAICDLIYTAVGLGLAHGYDLTGAMAEVQRSNMNKLHDGVVVYNKNGKVIKPKDWTPPKLENFMK